MNMPRGYRSRRSSQSSAATDTLDPTDYYSSDQETPTMSTAIDTDDDQDQDPSAQFELTVEEAPEDYTPDRRTPGRQRSASYFDSVLRADNVFNTDKWQKVPVTSQEHKAYVLRELNRAKLYLNGQGRLEGEPEIGLDLDDKKDDAVYFKSRVAQKRERKNQGEVLTENAQADGTYDENGDNDA
jgi:hypothetical protein